MIVSPLVFALSNHSRHFMNQEDLESTVRESLTLANVPKDAITQAINKLREAFRAEKEERGEYASESENAARRVGR